MTRTTKNSSLRLAYVLAATALASSWAHAQQLSGDELVSELSGGGYVLVMRHATSPMEPPSPRQTAPGNVDGERQLNQDGRSQMTAMGYAFRELGLPVGQVLSSPAYRAIESAEYFGFGELMEDDGLAPDADPGDLASKVAEAPAEGENRLIVTHRGNIVGAFGDAHGIETIEDGESLVFRPGDDGAELVGRMTIKDWAVAAVN